MSSTKLYETQNLYEAAYCLCKGLKLSGKKNVGKKVSLCFSGKDSQNIAMGFYNNEQVEAKALMDSYRTLKDYVFER